MRGPFFPLIVFIAVVWFISKDYDVPMAVQHTMQKTELSSFTSHSLIPQHQRVAHLNDMPAMPATTKELVSKITDYQRIGVDSSVLVNARGYVYRDGKYVPVHFLRNTKGMHLWIKGEKVRSWREADAAKNANLSLFNGDPLSLVARTYTGELIYLKYFTSHAISGESVSGFTGWILPDGARFDSAALPIAVVSEQTSRVPAASTDGRIVAESRVWPLPGEISPYMRWLKAY